MIYIKPRPATVGDLTYVYEDVDSSLLVPGEEHSQGHFFPGGAGLPYSSHFAVVRTV
ncbi:hypothetical protein SAMN04487819_103272 [Actinopolyspora alba]|uniref:Uncharacterized protein n=1 Tax=Actinopolyspora alba TaxID=673379 RepID=A0A1I1VCL4_9ACTN|nr:hypothetical protein SAMN04487819_103272 [Actinopolyspora alba]